MTAKKIRAEPKQKVDDIEQMGIAYRALMKIPREHREAALQWLNDRLESNWSPFPDEK